MCMTYFINFVIIIVVTTVYIQLLVIPFFSLAVNFIFALLLSYSIVLD